MTRPPDGPGRGGRGERPARPGGWLCERATAPAATLHNRGVPSPAVRAVHVLEVSQPALVLGSTQPEADVDIAACEAAGVEVVRRRSGGGAVLIEPADVVWVDVVVPAGDPRWDGDVVRSFYWLGRTWIDALAGLGLGSLALHDGPLAVGRWGQKVCFAGRGPGEVFDTEGRKVVGMAQRRTRDGSLFQCAVPLRWDPNALTSLLRWTDAKERDAATSDLSRCVLGVPLLANVVADAFVAALSAP